MKTSALLTTTAVSLFLCATAASAQTKSQEEKAAPGGMSQPAEKSEQPREKSSAQGEGKEPAKSKSSEPKQKDKGSAEKSSEPKNKATKGTAEKAPEPKEKSTKGTAETAPEPKDKGKGTAEKAPDRKDKGTKGAESSSGSGSRVQLTEEKRTNVGQTLAKEKGLNRAPRIDVTVNIGTRLPRSVRLVALPATIVAIVPEYRSYRYVVVEDRICIVEPSTYEIVEVIPISGQTASRSGGGAMLVLTPDERRAILDEVDMSGASTMGLGAISEGAEVPRSVKLQKFSGTVVRKVPKIEGYHYFTAEGRVAIVDPQGAKVQLVIESKR